MTDPADPEKQLKELQETIKILSHENEILAERAEDATLLGLIAEKISHLEDPKAVIETGLEQISLLKDIPICAYCSIVNGQILIENSFVSFSDAALEGISFILPATLAASRSIMLSGDDLHAANLAIGLPGKRYEPASLLLIAYETAYCPCGVFVFAADSDNGHFERCQDMLMRAVELLIYRVNTLHLLSELHETTEDLDRRVVERTRELSDAYHGLEQEMAERILAQEALQESEDKFRTIFNNAVDGILIVDIDTKKILVGNQMIQNMLGYDGEELRSISVSDIHPEKDLPYVIEQFEKQARKEIATAAGIPVKRRDGTIFIAEVNSSPITIQGREYLLGIFRDMTERRRAEIDILKSRHFSDSIINSLPDIFYLVDSNGNIVRVNEKFLMISGYSSAEVRSMHALDFFSEDEKKKVHDRIRDVFEKGESYVEADFLSRDGKRIPYYFSGYRGMIDNAPFLIGVGIDITDRRNSEKARGQSEEKYRSLFEESQDMVFIATYDGIFIDINAAGVARLGYSSKEAILAVPVRDIFAYSEDRILLLDLLVTNGFVSDFETTLLRKDGKKIQVSINATAVWDDLGKISAIRGIIRDITEHKKLEDQLRQSQKMESIGTLAGGIAHDFNNILTAIIGYGHLTMRKLEKDDPNRLNIEQMLEAAERAAHLTRDLLLFSRKQSIDKRSINLNEVITRLEKFLVRVIGEDISFQVVLHEAALPILGDLHQIEQVLMNLVTNARDAMPRGGSLTLSTSQIRLDEQFVNLYEYGKPGLYAMVTVSDTGEGMDEQTRQKIFEPFYTTKEVGKGTGLGLAVVYGIVRQHEGYINVYSEPGIGTTFRLYFPIALAYIREIRPDTNEQPAGGTETILLAEDNESVRDLTITVLEKLGYTVIVAADGEDAVNKYHANKESIQLLLFDLVMPKKSGKEAYDEIRQIRPDVKVLFATGYSPDIVMDKASLGRDANIIYKPMSPMDLLRKVRSVLDEGRD